MPALRPGLPTVADAFFGHALANDPNARFQSAGEMVQAFEAVALAVGNCSAMAPSELRPAIDVPTVVDRPSMTG